MYFNETDGGYAGTDNYANRFYNYGYYMAVGGSGSGLYCYETGENAKTSNNARR